MLLKCYLNLVILTSLILIVSAAFRNDQNSIPVLHRQKRIVNGKSVGPTDASYFVAILRITSFESTSKIQACGGTLISTEYVITAAHCVVRSDQEKLIVLLNGLWCKTDKITPNRHQSKSLVCNETIIHDQYNPTTLINDIGLIKLPMRIVETVNIKVIPLPDLDQSDPGRYEYKSGKICGIGSAQNPYYGQGDLAKYLQCATVVVTKLECLLYGIVLSPSRLCIKGPNAISGRKWGGASAGDSGGGLVIDRKLVGIISAVFKEHLPYGPSSYVNVAYYLDWIMLHTNLGI